MFFRKAGSVAVLRADKGEELGECVRRAFGQAGFSSAVVLGGIGMLKDVELAYFDGRDYVQTKFAEPMELVSFQGSIQCDAAGVATLHGHASFARKDKAVVGGHFVSGVVEVTGEVFLLDAGALNLVRKPEGRLKLLFPRD